MNYSNPDGQDCPDGDCHTSAPPSSTFSLLVVLVTDTQWVLHVHKDYEGRLLLCYFYTGAVSGLREGWQHDGYACFSMLDILWARQVSYHIKQMRLVNKLRHSHGNFTLDWQSICTLDWQSEGTNCRHQREFWDILNIELHFLHNLHIWYKTHIICTCTGRIRPSRRSVLLFANNSYQHNEKTHARCRNPQDSSW